MKGLDSVRPAGSQRIVVMVSGRGSNLIALQQALQRKAAQIQAQERPAAIVAVVADRACAGLAWAREQQLPAFLVEAKCYADRSDFDAELSAVVARCDPDLVVMAGFMRIVSARFLELFEGRVINVHPSLLPAFPGLHTHRRALEAGVLLHGATVHWVTPELDAGPIIGQAVLAIEPDDNEERLAARVLRMEHCLLPSVVGHLLGLGALAFERPPVEEPMGRGVGPFHRSPEAERILLVDPALCRARAILP